MSTEHDAATPYNALAIGHRYPLQINAFCTSAHRRRRRLKLPQTLPRDAVSLGNAAANDGATPVTGQRFERNNTKPPDSSDRELRQEEMAISVPRTSRHPNDASKRVPSREAINLVVVPAQKDGFRRVFLGQNEWYAIRIADALLPQLKYIAAYQSAPVSAITHYAEIDRIEPYGKAGAFRTYRVLFAGPANEIDPIPYADATPGVIQGSRYSSLAKLLLAKRLMDVF